MPLPPILQDKMKPAWDDKLNRLLQEVAWDAVVTHPLAGVQAEAKP